MSRNPGTLGIMAGEWMFIPPIAVIVGFDPFPCLHFSGSVVPFIAWFCLSLGFDLCFCLCQMSAPSWEGQTLWIHVTSSIIITKSSDIWFMIQEKHERSRGLVRLYGLVNHPPKKRYLQLMVTCDPAISRSSRHDAARHGATDPDLPWLQLFWGEHQPWDKGHGPHHGIWCLGKSFPRWAKRAK